jgi:threonine/homoserine/homoserine lactone efflux protein
MEYLLPLAGVALIHALAIMSPGPSFLLVVHASAGGGRRTGVATAFGVGSASLVLACAAMFGLTVIFKQADWLYMALRLAGGLYLVYLGLRLWLAAKRPLPDGGALEAGEAAAFRAFRSFRVGLVAQIVNPKAVLYFGSVFITLLPPHAPLWVLGAVLAIVFVNEFTWLVLIAVAFSGARARTAYQRLKSWIDRIAGGFLAALGLSLIVNDGR